MIGLGKKMQIAAITKQGLWTMAILVVILWGCLVGEHLMVQKASREMGQALHEMGRHQIRIRHMAPAAWPQRPAMQKLPPASS